MTADEMAKSWERRKEDGREILMTQKVHVTSGESRKVKKQVTLIPTSPLCYHFFLLFHFVTLFTNLLRYHASFKFMIILLQ